MQVFSPPDAHVAYACAQDRESANALLGKFNIFQIVEEPVLRGGETFSTSKDALKRMIHRWPDACYPHSCYNPFGVWRLRAAGSTKKLVKFGELTLVFVAALVAKLLAAKDLAGRDLTRAEVERIRDDATSIAMEPRDAQQVERKRCYTHSRHASRIAAPQQARQFGGSTAETSGASLASAWTSSRMIRSVTS
jgi:hypothetical protein